MAGLLFTGVHELQCNDFEAKNITKDGIFRPTGSCSFVVSLFLLLLEHMIYYSTPKMFNDKE